MHLFSGYELAQERTREHLRRAAKRQLLEYALATRPPRTPRRTPSLADVWRRLTGWRSFRPHLRGGDA
jgi:hypothetical protein